MRRTRIRPRPEINLAPFVDVVFLLVIFFMVSSTFITSETGLPIELPSAQTGVEEPRDVPTVVLDEKGRAYLGNRRLTDAALFAALQSRLSRDERGIVVLRADAKVAHGRVVEVMDLIRQAGAKRVAIAVVP